MLSRQTKWLRLVGAQKTITVRAMASSAVDNDEIFTESVGSKRVVTLNRPKALNALNLNMIRELYRLMKKWNDSEGVSMVIVKGAGAGGKAFCAGGDVLAVTQSARDAKAGGSSTTHKGFFREEYKLNHLIGTLRKPYVALIDGIIMGAGCGLAVPGRFRVSTDRTLLSVPETAIGLFPGFGASHFLPRLRDNLGLFLGLICYRLMGADAFHAGLATHFVNSAGIPFLEKALLNLEHPTDALVDETIRRFQPEGIVPFSLEERLPLIRELFKARTIEEIVSNLEKHGDDDWARKTVATLNRMSPTSLKVTKRQSERGASMSFAEFTMEYRLSQRFINAFDIQEGARAVLIDKDRNPRWKPATLAEVTDELVESYLAPLLDSSEELIIRED